MTFTVPPKLCTECGVNAEWECNCVECQSSGRPGLRLCGKDFIYWDQKYGAHGPWHELDTQESRPSWDDLNDALAEARHALNALAEAASLLVEEWDTKRSSWEIREDVERLRARLTEPRVMAAVRAMSPRRKP